MTKSTKKPCATPNQSTQSTQSVPKSILQQTGLIYRNFEKLASKSELYICLDADQETWKKALNELQFNSLPQLRQQINTLPKLLKPSELQDNMNDSLLKRIAEIQSGLYQTVDRISLTAAIFRYERRALPPQADDKHLKELKEFNREAVSFHLESLGDQLTLVFCSGANIMRKFTKSTKASSHPHPIFTINPTDNIIDSTTAATEEIDHTMKCLTSHEFITIQEEWGPKLPDYDDKINRLTQLINRTINHLEPQDDGESSDDVASPKKLTIQLARSFIPVLKLSRLFFKKLARAGLSKIPLKPYTDMNSHQLKTLSESAGYISRDLSRVVESIEKSDERNGYALTKSIMKPIDEITHRFDSNLLLVILYIIPLIPDLVSSHNELQNYFVTWNDLFLTATRNCICSTFT